MPPLPDSDDPFEILGVSSTCDRKTLKRAYARLVKIHRPDGVVQNFQKVQQAFEQAKKILGGEVYYHRAANDVQDWIEDDSGGKAPLVSAELESWTGVNQDGDEENPPNQDQAGNLVDDGKADDHPLDVVLGVLIADLDEAISAGATNDLIREKIRAGFGHSSLFIGDVFHEDRTQILDFIIQDLEISASELAAKTTQYAPEYILENRIDFYGRRGELALLLDQFEAPSFLRQLDDHENLHQIVLQYASGLAFQDVAGAERLFQYAARDAQPTEESSDYALRTRLDVAPAFRRWCATARPPTVLIQFLELSDSLIERSQLAIAEELQADFFKRPTRYLGAFDLLIKVDPQLFSFVYDQLESQVSVDDDDFRSHRTPIRRFLTMIENVTKVENSSTWKLTYYFSVGCVFLVFKAGGWVWGCVSTVLTTVAFIAISIKKNAKRYPKIVRPKALRLMLGCRLPSMVLAEGMKHYARKDEDISELIDAIEQDEGLYLASQIIGLRAEEEDSPEGDPED